VFVKGIMAASITDDLDWRDFDSIRSRAGGTARVNEVVLLARRRATSRHAFMVTGMAGVFGQTEELAEIERWYLQNFGVS